MAEASNLVARLRDTTAWSDELAEQAAAEIEQLRAALRETAQTLRALYAGRSHEPAALKGLAEACERDARGAVETTARREYHANGTYWSGVPTVDMPCDFCGRGIMAHEPRTHACPAVETTPQAPIANLVIDENGECSAACMYAPGLPPGEHDVYLDPAAPGLPVETPDGYRDAYYKIAELLGMSAMPISPKEAFEGYMLPRLRQLVSAEETTPKYGTCAVCGGVGGAHFTYCKDSPLKATGEQT